MDEKYEIENISYIISTCERNVNDLKKIIYSMITDLSIYKARSKTLDDAVSYLKENINSLENLFSVIDLISRHKDIRKRYVILNEKIIGDFNDFKSRLESIKSYRVHMNNLVEYIDTTRI
jgi:hypothetical protein